MSDNIKVVVKVRPLIAREIEEKLFYQWRVKNDTLYQIDQSERDVGPYFTFDKVYDKDTKTSDVYNDIAKPIVEAATAGFNGTIFAYGQTSSGKTYTMTGTDEAPGIIPLAVINLFEIIKNVPNRDFLVRVSFVEIYNETLIDLLNIEKKIKIQDTLQGVKVDATERVTSSPEEVLDAMKEGKANRQTAATNMNDESSRSHSIFQITIESKEHTEGEEEAGCVNVSQLNLVDLAGSERAGQTGATGLRFKEGTHINKSLSSLALVIKQLSDDPNKHVNYRDSKLTRILQNSLGGNAKTSIICAVTPAAVEETISTLQFANRAKSIKNKPAVNAVTTNATMIQQLTRQLSTLKTELENKKSVEKDNHSLQKKISALERLILNGFGQRSSAEIMNPRRKLLQPRRITISAISTLESIEEDRVSDVPKFCTPSLKYNPVNVPGVQDFQPIHSALSLPTLPEEPPRLVTPPPRDKKVNFEDEIIELDSDDDCSSNVQTCPTSPYHKCYESSKTPPCVLRKNAKTAEKDLKDLVELTEREKIFSPEVVEMMEKLDKSATTIAKLEDEVNSLRLINKEKDFERDKLKVKVSKAEEEIKMIRLEQTKLEARCKDYSIKLTDSEVSYENLMKKSKNREQELLSLLEDQLPTKPPESIGIVSIQDENDISSEKSENEQRLTHRHCDSTASHLSDLQKQLKQKDTKILELEATILAHEKSIGLMDTMSREYKINLDNYKEQLSRVEKELSQQKCTTDALKKIVETQNENIVSFNTDIESYKRVIRELQIQLQQKDNSPLNEIEIENLNVTEHSFLANNENIRNLIQSLKTFLQAKNDEIKTLKTSIYNNETLTDNLRTELDNKNKDVILLTEEIQQLKVKVDENLVTINQMLLEKNEWSQIKEQLNTEISELKGTINDLSKENEGLLKEAKELKTRNDEFSKNLNERHEIITLLNENYLKEQEEMCHKINSLKNEISVKDGIIESHKVSQEVSKQNLIVAKSAIAKVQHILSTLTGNVQNVPDIIDNFVSLFSALSDDLSTLEDVATKIKEQNKELDDIIHQHEEQHTLVEKQLDNIIDSLNKNEFLGALEINEMNLNIKEYIQNQINNKKMCYQKFNKKIDTLFNILKMKQTYYCQEIEIRNKEIAELQKSIAENKESIEVKDKELLLVREENKIKLTDIFLKQIFNKISSLTQCFDAIENNTNKSLNDEDNMLEVILSMLDKIAVHIKVSNSQSENNALEYALIEAKKDIQELTEQNLKFMNDVSRIEKSNIDTMEELHKIQQENKNLAMDLDKSSKVLELLKQQLQSKINEMELLEAKARNCKIQFVNLDFLIKEQMHAMLIENTNLKKRSTFPNVRNKCDDENFESGRSNNSSCYQPSLSHETNLKCPESLLTLCCNKIHDCIPTPNKNKTFISSSGPNTSTETACRCDKLGIIKSELQDLKGENVKLQSVIEEMIIKNKNLLKERCEVQNEVKSLLDVTYELQKKVVNHRTNLSTLTATTYAENKSLGSQIKFIQHHHNRLHNVCQRDIPALKKQLQELMILLKSDQLISSDASQKYSLPNNLEVPSLSSFKNDSTLDGELLMLDTNVTLTTMGDTTLVGHDQTCFDETQVCVYNEVACQTVDLAPVTNSTLLNSQIVVRGSENEIVEKVEELKKENEKLRELVDDYVLKKKLNNNIVNIQTSFIESDTQVNEQILKPLSYEDLLLKQEGYINEIELLHQKLSNLESEKSNILEKYNNLLLDVPATDLLVKKIGILEAEQREVDKIKTMLNNKTKELADLQDENDSLSNQVMEVITEVDGLRKEQDELKAIKMQLTEKCSKLQIEVETLQSDNQDAKLNNCQKCEYKSKIISSLEEKLSATSHSCLSRSFSDSDRTSSYNTICTLQSELHAGKEDCNKLKEEVTTIKNHLDRSNLSMGHAMDIDDSIVEPNIFSESKDFVSIESKCNMSDIAEDRSLELLYTLDKADCFKYYLEITGVKKEDVSDDIKIIDVMKMLYEHIIVKHANETENLVNKLRDFEDSKVQLQLQFKNLTDQYTWKTKELQEKSSQLETIEKQVSRIRDIISKKLIKNVSDDDIRCFRNTILSPLDSNFQLKTALLFDLILNRLTSQLDEKSNQFSELNNTLNKFKVDINTLNDNITELKYQLSEKENECNLLNKQKEIMHEINNTVTLDILQKEQELDKILTEGCQRLLEYNILEQCDIGRMIPLPKNIETIFKLITDRFVDRNKSLAEQNINLIEQVSNLKCDIAVRHTELQELTTCLHEKESNLLTQKTLFHDINQIYAKKVEENEISQAIINKLNEEINDYRQSLLMKDSIIKTLQDDSNDRKQNESLEIKIKELIKTKEILEQELTKIKAINEEISKENDQNGKQLEASNITINENKLELKALTSEILILKESVKENINIIDNLKQEAKLLLDQNLEIKLQLEETTKECSRLQMNIKTHEKSAEIQSRMIMRLQKQKEEDCQQKEKQIAELQQECLVLQKQCDAYSHDMVTCKDELKELNTMKDTLEAQVKELQETSKPRLSMDALAENSRRRRQSLFDSKRSFAEDRLDADEHAKMEAMFGTHAKNDDMFMDVDGNDSNRSSPIRRSKGRDSSQCKHEQDEEGSRPSSVLATRRRRQSAHDQQRAALDRRPEPHDLAPRKLAEHQEFEKSDGGQGDRCELVQVRAELASCREQLAELAERYRELDEECDTCAEYLREREAQCTRLRRERDALEQTVTELKTKTVGSMLNGSGRQTSFCDVAVNTDEDWANLHSVVVDRMSYDAEVEKNKKLTKAIEELRFNKQDLKNTIAKMQKALEKKSLHHNRELEVAKSELESCKEELEELKERYRELDEECATCAEYLRERDEQCRKLKEAKNVLEVKLKEYEEDASSRMLSVRKKRQSVHDQNRVSTSTELRDAATNTGNDLQSYSVEKDNSKLLSEDAQIKELYRLRLMVDKMSQQKAVLEQQLVAVSMHAPAYVATGSAIVQNQQITDVMKENQKLKKMNAKLIHICKKRGKALNESNQSNRENQDPANNI